MNMSHAVLGNKQREECVCSHIRKIPGRSLFDAQVFIDPLDNSIDPQGSILITLGTPILDELYFEKKSLNMLLNNNLNVFWIWRPHDMMVSFCFEKPNTTVSIHYFASRQWPQRLVTFFHAKISARSCFVACRRTLHVVSSFHFEELSTKLLILRPNKLLKRFSFDLVVCK